VVRREKGGRRKIKGWERKGKIRGGKGRRRPPILISGYATAL